VSYCDYYYVKVDKEGEAYEEAKAYLYFSGELGRKHLFG